MVKKQSSGDTPLSFLSGFVQSREIGRVIAQIDELTDQGSTQCWLMRWTRNDQKWARFVLEWSATRLWMELGHETLLFAVGPEGRVAVGTTSGITEELIDPSAEGPASRGHIRDLRGIGKTLYACGMGRQVYRRDGPGRWARQDQGAVVPPDRAAVTGFNSIDGLSEDDIYAVGYGGEIWRRLDERWQQIESPTNVILHRVRVIKKKLAYAAGQRGVLLRGSGNSWQAIKQETTEDNLWGMEWFKGSLYLSSEDAIYRLNDRDELDVMDTPGIDTCGHLHANDGVMWSFGTKNVAWTEDAVTWNDVTP